MTPQSFAPIDRLTAESTRPPIKPPITVTADISAACHRLNGVSPCSSVPRQIASRPPPIRPSHVFDGLTRGESLCLPQSLPQTYWNTSLDCTTSRKNSSNGPLLSK